MATDARYHMCAWEPPDVGHDAIGANLLGQGEAFTDLHIEVLSIGSAGPRVFTERIDTMTMNEKPVSFHLAGVFEIDDDGRIAVWRDYLDRREIAAQLGPR